MKCELLHLKDFYPFLGNEGCDPTVEVYLPYNLAEMKRENFKRPCLVVCPGGGYAGCSEREGEPITLNFLSEGFNVFVIKYSVAPHRFPTQLIEIAALMDLINKNSDRWNCDTSKITIMGFSAGGHLAAHYSTMFDCEEVRKVFPKSIGVNASILSYPVITADPNHSHQGSFENLLGIKEVTEDIINTYSCDRLVKENTPPAFIWHTAEDNSVPVMNSLLYASALSRYNIPFELHIYPFGGHGSSTCDKHTLNDVSNGLKHAHAWMDSAKKWLRFMNLV